MSNNIRINDKILKEIIKESLDKVLNETPYPSHYFELVSDVRNSFYYYLSKCLTDFKKDLKSVNLDKDFDGFDKELMSMGFKLLEKYGF